MQMSLLDKELCRRLSQSAHAIIGHHVLVTDINGTVLGSDDNSRVGTLHEASLKVLSTGKQAYHDHAAANSLSGTRPGMTIPLRIDGHIVGTIGITGNPENISKYAMLIQQLAQTFFDFQAKQYSAQYVDYEKLSLVHDLTTENLADNADLIHDRAFRLGYDLDLPRIVLRMVMTPVNQEKQASRNWLSRRVAEKMAQMFSEPQDFICVQNSTEIVAMPLLSDGSMKTIQEKVQQLFELIAGLENVQDCQALFEDLCTVKEIENMAERVFAARLLTQGCTYNQIMAQSDISSATLSRVSRCVQYGKGYSKLLK